MEEPEPNEYRTILCSKCDVRSILKRGAKSTEGVWIHIKYKWICSKCKVILSQDNRPQTNLLEHLPFNDGSRPDDDKKDSTATAIAVDVPEEIRKRGMLFCHQNLNSIRNKFTEIKNFLIDLCPTVFSITESKLDSDRDKDCMYFVTGYYMLRYDRIGEGGGSLLYISDNYNFEEIEINVKIPDKCEITVVKIWKHGVKPIAIITVYKHPDTKISIFSDVLVKVFEYVDNERCEIVMHGDFNINLKPVNGVIDREVFEYFQTCKELGLWQLMQSSTHNQGGLLDHVYVNIRQKYLTQGNFPFAGSDHNLCFTIRKKAKIQSHRKVINVRKWKKVDWEQFRKDLSCWRQHIDDSEDSFATNVYLRNIDITFNKINEFTMGVLDKYAPSHRMRVKGRSDPWFSTDVRVLCKHRNKLQRLAQKSNDIQSWKEYRQARNAANVAMRRSRDKYIADQFETQCDSESMWNTVDSLTNFRAINRNPITFLEVGKKRIYDKVDIQDQFAEKFVLQNLNRIDITEEIKEYGSKYKYDDSEEWDIEPIQVTGPEVGRALNSVKCKKSHNPSHIVPAKLMKNSGPVFISMLVHLFNIILASKSIPTAFKKAKIRPLYKGKGSRKKAENYRPISLLIDFCKIFEKFLSDRVLQRVQSQLSDKQHAYKKDRSCHTALTILINDIYKAIEKPKTKVGAVFIDFTKAFDSLDHVTFVRKLMNEYELEPWYVETLHENFKHRVFSIDEGVKCYNLTRGLCQGSANGPLAFTLYIDSLSKLVNCAIIMYADDIVIYAEGKTLQEINEKLVENLAIIDKWCNDNFMLINYSKTKCMYFHKSKDNTIKNDKCNINAIEFNGNSIERVFSFKYLGVMLDPCLNFKDHYDIVMSKMSGRIKYIRGFKRFFTPLIFRIMVNAYIHSVLDYAIDIWAIQSDAQLDKLQRKVDRLLIEFEYGSSFKRRIASITDEDIGKLRKKYNFLSLRQRRDYVLLKGAFYSVKQGLFAHSQRQVDKDMPILTVPKFQSKVFRDSPHYRQIILWNKLPKDVKVKLMTKDMFKRFTKNLLFDGKL